MDGESLNGTCYRNSYGFGEIWASLGRAYRSDIDMKNGGKSFPSGGNPLSEGAEKVLSVFLSDAISGSLHAGK